MYKRQLYSIHKYLEINGGRKPSTPLTFIFGAKAAPAYVIAQDIILSLIHIYYVFLILFVPMGLYETGRAISRLPKHRRKTTEQNQTQEESLREIA